MPKPKPEDFLNLLGNKHRRRIIQLCSIRPLYPQKIAEILGITVPAVIKHRFMTGGTNTSFHFQRI